MREHSTQEEDTEVNMTPMLDIVFIMLIFFIVTAVFVKESGETVTKPEAVTWRQLKQVSALIAVTEDDKVHIDKKEVELTAIRTVVEKLYKENPKGLIAIQADDKAKAGIVMKTYDAVRSAGVERIAFATEKK